MNTSPVRIAGRSEQLDKRLGKGGEGDVYALAGRNDRAVKIYKAELRPSRESKVRAMVEGRLAESTNLVAFPFDVATDSSGLFVGFSMRLVAGYRPIHELYSPKSRKIHFPKADYRFLVRVAQNVARAVATVHQAGCIIGDLNHSGVLIGPDATVALIDADSFQFSLKGHLYPCVVGTEDFTPPELHGISLSNVKRTQAHDNFGLAVAIFQLLAMGKHPYAGRFNGPDLSLGQSIAQNRFAFSVRRRDETRTTPPPGSVLLDDLPSSIATAFETAFGLSAVSRPDSPAWVSLLQGLETSLRQCSTVQSHYFPGAAGSCLWCRLASQSGVEMFPLGLGMGNIPAIGSFDLERIWAAIQAVRLPLAEEVIPTWSGDVDPPGAAITEAKSKGSGQAGLGALAIIGAVIGFTFIPVLALLWGCLGIYGLTGLFSKSKVDAAPFLKAYKDADNRVRQASLAYLQRIGLKEMYVLRADLEELVAQYRQVEGDLSQTLMKLKSTREARQRTDFLDRFLIRRATIPGIGPAKTATLASFGIETAADITASSVQSVPGFGEALTGKMLAWRQSHEAKFRYNSSPNASDLQAENAVRSSSATKQMDLQNRLRAGLSALQAALPRIVSAKSLPDQNLMQALAERAVALRDCAILEVAVPAPAVVTIEVPKRAAVQPNRIHTPTPSHSSSAGSIRLPASNRCPSCGASMVRRTARKGKHAGSKFWGCSKYPACKGTRS
ncbi:topoisomerase DNA-binding C4 zinc finger domain-containing protein [Devosia sp.]|uniref:topoisomerase DNA-binding C4 zinc finger domain-containing protein n=1 Tax=Devosia sp. TaxID=1871048 RepID=UPI0027369B7A|nr:topoisomerase DNA-binding C4 zinc finger domain-containing protein [Devosia sp.]MDP2782552.1 topoisomerase DNA-binding C4 zinc finger domain-containing protein [Devosia sp.]